MAFIRGYNPVWSFVDLVGNQLDDTYYLFVLQNELPYLPATVYHTPSGIPWVQPIQFLANGTLPIDIFWEEDTTIKYRLEIRQGNTQSDPLTYLIENYSPTDGSGSITLVALPTDNQITNPQFALINFVSPYTLSASSETISVAPGWDLVITGSGTVTLTQIAKNFSDNDEDTTNAPYALNVNLGAGVTGILRQRFQQNGILWAGKSVVANVTAKANTGTPAISARLIDSNGTVLGTVISSVALTGAYVEYQGSVTIVAPSSNPDVPPSAYIDFELALPENSDINLTSFQIIAGDVPNLPAAYEQTTIDRQIDHTFHNYRNSLLLEAKGDILTGWDFALNPWQFRSTAQTNVANNTYTADQTIIIQQAFVASATGNNVSVGQADFSINYGLTVQAVTANNQFAILQYIDPVTCRPYWGKILSSYIRLTARKQNSATLRVKAKLIYRASLPSTISQTEPVASWTALGEPVLAAGWTAVNALNNPTYSLVDGVNELYFDKFDLTNIPSTNANMTMGLLVYTLDLMIDSGTPDNITFNKINLIPNDYASDSVSLTNVEAYQRCMAYYQKSFPQTTMPANNTGLSGVLTSVQTNGPGLGSIDGAWHTFVVPMRTTPALTYYNALGGTAGQIRTGEIPTASWSATTTAYATPTSFLARGTTPAGTAAGLVTFVHFVADARLGV